MNLLSKPFSFLVPDPVGIHLMDLDFQDGHTSLDEHLIIAQIVAHFKPETLLEIGTFDGNTTAILAANSPQHAIVHTIDLPEGKPPSLSIHPANQKYILKDKRVKKYQKKECFPEKVIQHYGNTLDYDFSFFAKKGPLHFIFIDACHDYEYVKNDTEKAFAILAKGGIILWHDFTPIWPGVHRYLTELCEKVTLTHIDETSLVIFKSD